MGKMIMGEWKTDAELAETPANPDFRRPESQLRDWITKDGVHPPEAGRYHLYGAWNCPWAHRAILLRHLKKLAPLVGLSLAAPKRTDQGWVFDPGAGFSDDLFGSTALHELYGRSHPDYTGRVTVPILWDKTEGRIVSNESADIVRMFNSAFDGVAEPSADLAPDALLPEIEAWNERIYRTLNNGVYRAGFARAQDAYNEAVREVFDTLDAIEARLGEARYLCGDMLTEADWRLFPTLVRFDVAYFGAFKCNRRRLMDYPNLWAYTRDLYQVAGVAETVHPEIYKRGYFSKSEARNPYGIVPKGPVIDFAAPHGRDAMLPA